MKKALYIILLAVELVVGLVFLTLVTGGAVGWTYFWITTAVWAALMALMLVKLKMAADGKGKRAAKIAIALVMLIPLAAALGALHGLHSA